MNEIAKNKTPEEKLLKIIEGGDDSTVFPKRKKINFKLNLRGIKFPEFNIKKIKFKNVNVGLFILVIILTVIFAVIFLNEKKTFSKRIVFLEEKNKKPSAIFFESKEKKPTFEEYILEVKRNNPFDIFVDTAHKKKEIKTSFKLAGIIWSDNPQAIIEEETTNRTYTLYNGDELVGGYKVIKIMPNGVQIRGRDGEETLR